MKHFYSLIVTLLLLSMHSYGSAPEKIKYQAIVRDNNGNVLTNHNVSLRVSILKTSTSGTAVYVETHAATSNILGLINLEIGGGAVVSGSMAAIQWGDDDYFIKLEMDDNGGTNYSLIGTSQLVSVPYSLYAKKAANGTQWKDTANNIYYNDGSVGIDIDNPHAPLEVKARNGKNILITGDVPTIRMADTSYTGNGVMIGIANDSNSLVTGSGKGDVVFTNEAYGAGGSYIFGTGVPSSPCVKVGENCFVGIGTNQPVSTVDVSGGDINVEDVGSGVIMKSPDGQCWRLTVSNSGVPVFTTINCPTYAGVQNNCHDAIACYPFNGNANDVSGHNLNGTVLGAILTTGHKGNANSAYQFNASAATRIELPNLSSFDNADEITVSIWAKTDSVVGYGTTIVTTFPDTSTDRFQMNINWSGTPLNTNIFDYGNIAAGRLTSPSSAVAFNTWEHYVFVKSTTGSFMKIYKNGVEIATKAGGTSISNKNKKVVLGGSPANSQHVNQFFHGALDDLKIFNRALSPSEVLDIYNTEK